MRTMGRLVALFVLLCAPLLAQQPHTIVDGPKASYSATKTAQTSVAGCSYFIQGSSTKTIRVVRVTGSYISSSTTIAYHTITMQRYSALSGGTNNAVTSAKYDTNDGNATAVVDQVSVVNTTQTAVGGAARSDQGVAMSTTAAATNQVQRFEWDFGEKPGQRAFVLRGTGDFACVVFDAATATYNLSIEWTEE